MSILTFDKLAFVDSLTKGGVPEDQARTHANALDTALRDTVATKADLAELRAELRAGLAEFKTDILKWMCGALLGQTAILAALVKLL